MTLVIAVTMVHAQKAKMTSLSASAMTVLKETAVSTGMVSGTFAGNHNVFNIFDFFKLVVAS